MRSRGYLRWLQLFLFLFVLGLGNAFAYTVSGTVNGGDFPLPDATVQLFSTSDNTQYGGVVKTDPIGRYTVNNVPDGTYKLYIIPPGGSSFHAAWFVDPPVVVSGGNATRDAILIPPTSSISGTVRTPAGGGASNIQVCAYPASGSAACAFSDETGGYRLDALDAGTYRVDVAGGYGKVAKVSNVATPYGFSMRGYLAALAVSGAARLDISLPFVTMSGKTTDKSGIPLAGVTVAAHSATWIASGISYTCRFDPVADQYKIISDLSGNYSMVLLPYGSYQLSLTPPEGAAAVATALGPVAVTTDLARNLTLDPPSAISGTVRTPAGTGASNIQVCAYGVGGSSSCALTDGTGGYRIEALSTANYRIDVAGGYGKVAKLSNVPTPYRFSMRGYVAALAVKGEVQQDVALPFVTLSGVTTDRSGAPVAGVTVAVPSASWSSGGVSYSCGNDSTASQYKVVSDSSGKYSMVLLPYESYLFSLAAPDAAAVIDTTISPVAVAASATKNLPLDSASSISGTVRTPAGLAASNIQVCAYPASGSGTCVTSDTAGGYRIDALAEGSYRLDVAGGYGKIYKTSNVATPYAFSMQGYVAALAVKGAAKQDVTLPFVTLSGRTTDGSGNPVAGVVVSVPPATWSEDGISYSCRHDSVYSLQRAVSDASGFYRVVLLPYGSYQVTLTPPDGAPVIATTVSPVAVTANTARDFALNAPSVVSGVVRTPAGAAAGNIQVCAYPASGSGFCALSDASGAYRIASLPPGTYRIDLAGGYAKVQKSSTVPTPYGFSVQGYAAAVAVNGEAKQDVVLPFVTLSGKTTTRSGAPLAGVTVSVPPASWSENGISYSCRNDGSSDPYKVVSDPSGNYTLVLLPYGSYQLSLTPPAGTTVSATTLSPVAVTANTAKNLPLDPATGIAGVVRTPAGSVASNIQVCAYPASGSGVCATSDSTGVYSIRGLDAGTYRLDVAGGYGKLGAASTVATPYDFTIRGYLPGVVVDGEEKQDITLPFVTLSGKTTDSNGVPVSGVSVSVPSASWSANGASYTCRNDGAAPYSVLSDTSGSYSMVLLAYDKYVLSVTPPAGGKFVSATISGCNVAESRIQNITLGKSVAEHAVTVLLSGGGSGSVASFPAGLTSQRTKWLFEAGTAVTLSATPATGSVFAGWSGACSGKGACSVTLTGDLSVTASFLSTPKPVSSTPADGASAVPVNVQLSATFSEEMDPASITSDSVSLSMTNGLRAVAAGGHHVVGVRRDGTVVAWGSNVSSQTAVPAGLAGVTAVAAGYLHSLALKGDGTVVAWGSTSYGISSVPAGLADVVAIAAGNSHSLALKKDGTVVAWGLNGSGQCTVPAGLSGVKEIAAGYDNSFAVMADGTVVAWGSNAGGKSAPAGVAGVTAVGAGTFATYALTADGTVTTLGTGNPPAGLAGVAAVSAGHAHGLALKGDGTVVAWGANDFGQGSVPSGLSGVSAVSAGAYFSVALRKDGSLVIWGDTLHGEGSVPSVSTVPVAATVSYDPATHSAIVTPEAPLQHGGSYTVTVGTSVRGTNGIPLSSPLTWSFATSTDSTPPTASAQPGSGTYPSSSRIVLSANEAATIYYTTDGSAPTTASAVYSAPLALSGAAVVTFFAVDAGGNPGAVVREEYLLTDRLTVTLSGTGSGTVNSSPALSCAAGSCTANLTPGTPVIMIATPSADSTFAGWQGACTNTKGYCIFAMQEGAAVTATFTKAPPVKLLGSAVTDFSLIQKAYDSCSSGNTIASRGGSLSEALVFARPVTVRVRGGYDAGYGSNAHPPTRVNGSLKIRSGTVRVENMAVY